MIRYNAVPSQALPASMTQLSGVTHADDNVVIIVNVQRPKTGRPINTVAAQVKGTARDLLGNKRSLTFKPHRDAGNIDYLAQTRTKNKQTLIFDLTITPEGGPTKAVQFQQTFYTRH